MRLNQSRNLANTLYLIAELFLNCIVQFSGIIPEPKTHIKKPLKFNRHKQLKNNGFGLLVR